MWNSNPIWTISVGSKGASSFSGSFKPVNVTRLARHEARVGRRQGNWDNYLLMPTALLWLESAPEMCLGDECEFEAPAVIDLWP